MKHQFLLRSLSLMLIFLPLCSPAARAQFNEVDDLAAEQAKEKLELEDMRKELGSIKGEVKDALRSMSELTNAANTRLPSGAAVQEIHLFAKEAEVDIGGGQKIQALTYNGQIPGPEIHLREGEPTKIVLHNELGQPTSLHFHGIPLPHGVDGLPRAGKPVSSTRGEEETGPKPERYLRSKETFVYQFVPQMQSQTTAYYHPQIMHLKQRQQGLYGALIVHPRLAAHRADQDLSLFFTRVSVKGNSEKALPAQTGAKAAETAERQVFLVNGKTAPYIPALQVTAGKRIRLRLFNLTEESIPLHLSGHRLEVVGMNGSDPLEPHTMRDTVTLASGDRLDVEFTADNPGVWSLASDRLSQVTDKQGNFPHGLAIVVKYKQ
ncbi:MAG TPA: multicopper oxidase domain-containing protein [Candidatus Obscuribacter sp.]|nr:multicopper oxidase domain-containing protein [Candidatus Obscuribacter sp.]